MGEKVAQEGPHREAALASASPQARSAERRYRRGTTFAGRTDAPKAGGEGVHLPPVSEVVLRHGWAERRGWGAPREEEEGGRQVGRLDRRRTRSTTGGTPLHLVFRRCRLQELQDARP
jgi:hypothetical protein